MGVALVVTGKGGGRTDNPLKRRVCGKGKVFHAGFFMSVRRPPSAPSATTDAAVARLRVDLERAAIAERARARAAPTGPPVTAGPGVPPAPSAPRTDPEPFNTVFKDVPFAVEGVVEGLIKKNQSAASHRPLCADLRAWCAVNSGWCTDDQLWREAALQAFNLRQALPQPPKLRPAIPPQQWQQERAAFFAAVPPVFASLGMNDWRAVFHGLCNASDSAGRGQYDRINWGAMKTWGLPRMDAELTHLMDGYYDAGAVAVKAATMEALKPEELVLRAWLLLRGADVERYLVSDAYAPSRRMFELARERRYGAAQTMIDEQGAHIDFVRVPGGEEDTFVGDTLWTIMAQESLNIPTHERSARNQICHRLTANKALMNYVRPDGHTALSLACRNHMQAELTLYIIRNGGAEQVNLFNAEGKTPVWYAAKIGWVSVVETLVEFGADVNAYADKLMSPLFHAVWHSIRHMVRFLLENGADVQIHVPWNISNAMGEGEEILPIAYAVEHGDSYIVSQLIKHGANKTPEGREATSSGRTLLHTALARMNYRVALALLEAGDGDPALQFNRDALNGELQNGKSALFWAVKYDNKQLADLIVRYGGTQMINDIEAHPFTLIQRAIVNRSRPTVDLLLFHGADVDQQDTATSKTAIDLAAEWGEADVFQAVAAQTQQHPLDVTRILHDALEKKASVPFIKAILTPANHAVDQTALHTYIRQAEVEMNYHLRAAFELQAESRESQILDALQTKLG